MRLSRNQALAQSSRTCHILGVDEVGHDSDFLARASLDPSGHVKLEKCSSFSEGTHWLFTHLDLSVDRHRALLVILCDGLRAKQTFRQHLSLSVDIVFNEYTDLLPPRSTCPPFNKNCRHHNHNLPVELEGLLGLEVSSEQSAVGLQDGYGARALTRY